MGLEKEAVVVVIILDRDTCRWAAAIDSDTAMTLIAVASEDPSGWEDIVAYWSRYRTPAVAEFADSLPLLPVDFAAAQQKLRLHDSWVVIDLIQKRILTGRDFQPIVRDDAFAMVVDDEGRQHWPLSIHLPPWWELHSQTDASAIDRERETPLVVPRTNRDFLYGQALLDDLAARMLDAVVSEPWKSRGADDDWRARYEFTVAVHRDWLMTPRTELGGRFPRQLLHGGREWIDRLIWAQQIRFHDSGEIVAAPTNVSDYHDVPLAGEEMAIYFDLCRELIGEGWQWCVENGSGSNETVDRPRQQRQLAAHLAEVKEEWLDSPFEGGSPPRFIIECSRRRVPRGTDVPIVGMAERETVEHTIDCDCPICEMMADGMFGVAFTGIDGHHLELDDEFAFSMHETREEWEAQQREFEEMSAAIDRQRAEREAAGESEADPFASAWSGHMSDDPLPGDPLGHMKLAFLLAEVVGMLQSVGAPQDDIQTLNACFTAFRRDRADLPSAGQQLGDCLEDLAQRYPEILSRVADFQSRIDEQIRTAATDDDVPF